MWPHLGRSRQVSDALGRIEALERRLKVMEADWDEWYDKFRRLYARLSKRVERDEKDLTLPDNGRSPHQPAPTMAPLAAQLLRGPTHPGA